MTLSIHSLAISARLVINLHSLNNEGTEGNQVQTRQVTIVDQDGDLKAVNAISGDMFKHIMVEHFQALAMEQGQKKLPLCAGCQTFDADRINKDKPFMDGLKKNQTEAIDQIISHCALDDVAGILVTAGNRSLARKSVAEFGWVIGIPEKTRTDTFFHVKYDPSERGAGSGDEANTGQAIFHRPASSGVYALVLNLDLFRVGRNDISLKYVLDKESRAIRIKTLLESVVSTFIKPTGAMRNTQNPHIINLEGVICYSTKTVPAPMVSGLTDNYPAEIVGIAKALNSLHPGAIKVIKFNGHADFAEKMANLINEVEPWGA
jgi:CRISPR-associated protein Cst2